MKTKTNNKINSASALTEPLLSLEKKILMQQIEIETWFRQQWQETQPLFYGSVDLRNSGYKLAPVDTNLFPGGFSNLNPEFMSLYVQSVQVILSELCPDATRLLIIPESHTRNIFYLESIAVLQEIFIQAGYETRLGHLRIKEGMRKVDLPSGKSLHFEPIHRKDDQVRINNFSPCCVILNNDLSEGIPDILQNLSQKIMPPIQLGWSTRLKSEHFRFYEQVSTEFAKLLDFDPWIITPWFDQCPEVNFMKKEGEACLISRAETLLERIRGKYAEYQIKQSPFLAIKADQGTYGMAVMMIQEPQELRHLNRKQRSRMSTIKGGVPVTKAIIQEGVYTFETSGSERAVAEPVVYLFGRHVVGGFYRVHDKRGPAENLNAPGMNFHPLPFEQPCNVPCPKTQASTHPFYFYGVFARLALLAAARELAAFEKGVSK